MSGFTREAVFLDEAFTMTFDAGLRAADLAAGFFAAFTVNFFDALFALFFVAAFFDAIGYSRALLPSTRLARCCDLGHTESGRTDSVRN